MSRSPMCYNITLLIFCIFFLFGCATMSPLSSRVTEAERQAVYADLKNNRKDLHQKEKHLREVGRKLLAQAPEKVRKEVKFKIGGIFSGVNAYSDGKSRIFVSPEMMRFVQNDNELAFVLSHELGHILKGHHAKTSVGHIFSAAAGAVVGAYADKYSKGTGQLAAPAVDAVAWSPFSKEMEMEADEAALSYMKKAGYDLSAGTAVLKRFAVEIPATQKSSITSTHPASPERLTHLQMLIGRGGQA